MKLSQVIAELKALSRSHGNVEVCVAEGICLKKIHVIEFEAATTDEETSVVSIVPAQTGKVQV